MSSLSCLVEDTFTLCCGFRVRSRSAALRLDGNRFDLDQEPWKSQAGHHNSRTGRWVIAEDFSARFEHIHELAAVGDIGIDLDNMLHLGTRRSQNRLDIAEDLARSGSSYCPCRPAFLRVERDLAGHINGVADLLCLAKGSLSSQLQPGSIIFAAAASCVAFFVAMLFPPYG